MTGSNCFSVPPSRRSCPAGAPRGSHGHVVSYRHVTNSLRRKPMASIGLVYRDQLFPSRAFRDMFAALLEKTAEKTAYRVAVDLLGLAV